MFKPKIVAFLCNWCTYTAADLAGVSRMKFVPNIRVIRVMCSGRVTPELVVKALKLGADGVFIGGCHTGDCHYINGNHRTAKRMLMLKRLLDYMGLESERVRFEHISAAEAIEYTQVVNEFTDTIKKLGPNKLFKDAREEFLNEQKSLHNEPEVTR